MSELAKNLNEIVLGINLDLKFHNDCCYGAGREPNDWDHVLPYAHPTRAQLKAWVSVLNEAIRMAKETGKVEA